MVWRTGLVHESDMDWQEILAMAGDLETTMDTADTDVVTVGDPVVTDIGHWAGDLAAGDWDRWRITAVTLAIEIRTMFREAGVVTTIPNQFRSLTQIR